MTSFLRSLTLVAFGLTAVGQAQDIAGRWQGTLEKSHTEFVLNIVLTPAKKLAATITQRGRTQRLPVENLTVHDREIRFEVLLLDSRFQGIFNARGDSFEGTWKRLDTSERAVFTRPTAETAWEEPAAAHHPKMMAPTANAHFDVSTVKPAQPGEGQRGSSMRGAEYRAQHMSVADLITMAYGLKPRQVVGLPKWAEETYYDLDAKYDAELGEPDGDQLDHMMRQLIHDRFGLQFHFGEQEMPIKALVVDGQPKLTPSSAQDQPRVAFWKMGLGGRSILIAQNTTMENLAGFLMTQITDRQVVDQTGLQGKFDFQFYFLPTGKHAPAGEVPGEVQTDPLPDAEQAMAQLGLKIKNTTGNVRVLVVDSIKRPELD